MISIPSVETVSIRLVTPGMVSTESAVKTAFAMG
jgi:hypothetical protein